MVLLSKSCRLEHIQLSNKCFKDHRIKNNDEYDKQLYFLKYKYWYQDIVPPSREPSPLSKDSPQSFSSSFFSQKTKGANEKEKLKLLSVLSIRASELYDKTTFKREA